MWLLTKLCRQHRVECCVCRFAAGAAFAGAALCYIYDKDVRHLELSQGEEVPLIGEGRVGAHCLHAAQDAGHGFIRLQHSALLHCQQLFLRPVELTCGRGSAVLAAVWLQDCLSVLVVHGLRSASALASVCRSVC